jgi:hypothetical protein
MLKKKAQEEKRFRVVFHQGFASAFKVIKDTKTGVLYLFHNDGAYGSGLTPLLGSDGKPLIDPGK